MSRYIAFLIGWTLVVLAGLAIVTTLTLNQPLARADWFSSMTLVVLGLGVFLVATST